MGGGGAAAASVGQQGRWLRLAADDHQPLLLGVVLFFLLSLRFLQVQFLSLTPFGSRGAIRPPEKSVPASSPPSSLTATHALSSMAPSSHARPLISSFKVGRETRTMRQGLRYSRGPPQGHRVEEIRCRRATRACVQGLSEPTDSPSSYRDGSVVGDGFGARWRKEVEKGAADEDVEDEVEATPAVVSFGGCSTSPTASTGCSWMLVHSPSPPIPHIIYLHYSGCRLRRIHGDLHSVMRFAFIEFSGEECLGSAPLESCLRRCHNASAEADEHGRASYTCSAGRLQKHFVG